MMMFKICLWLQSSPEALGQKPCIAVKSNKHKTESAPHSTTPRGNLNITSLPGYVQFVWILSGDLFSAFFHSRDVCDGGIHSVFRSSVWLSVVGKGRHSATSFSALSWPVRRYCAKL